MRVAVDMPESIREPYLQVHHEHGLEMTLGSGSIEAGPRRSQMTRNGTVPPPYGSVGWSGRPRTFGTQHFQGSADGGL
jgi:hypothetical protein